MLHVLHPDFPYTHLHSWTASPLFPWDKPKGKWVEVEDYPADQCPYLNNGTVKLRLMKR